jgi:hypothetical protein
MADAASSDGRAPVGDPLDVEERGRDVDYAGAIYGSLLAASTVVGTAASRVVTTNELQLLVALVTTSVVFWLLHVYVRVVGRELPRGVPWRTATRRSAAHELPILVAVVPPSAALVLAALLGESDVRAGWWALWVAVIGQACWTWVAVRRAQAARGVALLSMAVSLALGLVLIALKVALTH